MSTTFNKAINVPVIFSQNINVSNRTCVLAATDNVDISDDEYDIGDVYVIKNWQTGGTITVNVSDPSIDGGSSTLTLNAMGCVVLCWFGAGWAILSLYNP